MDILSVLALGSDSPPLSGARFLETQRLDGLGFVFNNLGLV